MKKLLTILLTALFPFIGISQDTVRTHYVIHRVVIHKTVLDTMPAQIFNDLNALGVKGNVDEVITTTVNYQNNTVVNEHRIIDENGYSIMVKENVASLPKSYAGMTISDLALYTDLNFTNAITKKNNYKYNKIQSIECSDMVRGDYTINFRYDLVGNVIGTDTIYNDEHHLNHTIRYDRYHNPYYKAVYTNGVVTEEYRYKYKYDNDNVTFGKIIELTIEKSDLVNKTKSLTNIIYNYNDDGTLNQEIINDEISGQCVKNYKYSDNGKRIHVSYCKEGKKFDEITIMDDYGSIILKEISENGKVMINVVNDITYSGERNYAML